CRLGRLMVDRLAGVLLRGLDLGGVVLRHALLEGLDARREVAHQLGDLAAAAEQEQHGEDDEHPMYPPDGTPRAFPPPGPPRPAPLFHPGNEASDTAKTRTSANRPRQESCRLRPQ